MPRSVYGFLRPNWRFVTYVLSLMGSPEFGEPVASRFGFFDYLGTSKTTDVAVLFNPEKGAFIDNGHVSFIIP